MTGTIRRLKRNKWEIAVDVGKDRSGKRRRRSRTVRGTKTDAERELRAFVAEVERVRSSEPSPTTAEWLRKYHAEHVIARSAGSKPWSATTPSSNRSLSP